MVILSDINIRTLRNAYSFNWTLIFFDILQWIGWVKKVNISEVIPSIYQQVVSINKKKNISHKERQMRNSSSIA